VALAGRGERDPIASNATAAGKAQNRRVEIVIRPLRG
jgi:outer membrane protein OmpA-like peptidoglycan-associated protein